MHRDNFSINMACCALLHVQHGRKPSYFTGVSAIILYNSPFHSRSKGQGPPLERVGSEEAN
jgi:hypothetical protein